MSAVKRETPGPGQESVWDYPRPPRCEPVRRHIQVTFGGVTIADTRRAVRVLETGHPPVYYIPPSDIAMNHLEPSPKRTFCEWKGTAHYYTVKVGGRTAKGAAFAYEDPEPQFARIMDYIAFYAVPMDSCTVDGEEVRSQAGAYYAGWITKDVAGPFKGAPGTEFW